MKLCIRILCYIFLFILSCIITFYMYAFFNRLSLDEQRNNITIYDQDGEVMYESNFTRSMSWTDIDDIPQFIQDAFVAVEDKRFYYHAGVDPLRIIKALGTNLLHGDILQGGSTITQQYAKNLFLTNEQTISRKVQELFYAVCLEMQYSKKNILEGYLNTIYFGHGIYGIKEAAEYFFETDINDLTTAQVAMLVGIPNGPSIYSPYLNEEQSQNRQQLMLSVFLENGLIDESTYTQAINETLQLANHDTAEDQEINQYYVDAVLEELSTMDLDLEQELNIYTYYDKKAQQALTTAISQNVSTDSELETAAIITQPFTAGILAIAGGKDYTVSQYNRAIYANRQVASTIKPLLYYCALTQGFTPTTKFVSQKTTFRISDTEQYSPSNYGDLYANDEITMINALALSDNIYAVKTHLFLGVETLHNTLLEFGISQSQANPSEALGTVNMSLLELSSIYTTFASEGLYSTPTFIRSISNAEDEIYKHEPEIIQLLDRDTTLVLNQMLRAPFDIQNKNFTLPSMYGYEPNTTMAAKSGTSDWDSLVMAYNPEYVIGIWCGFDDNRNLGKSNYTIDKLIFQDTMNALYEEQSGPWYQMSDAIEERQINPITGEDDESGSVYWFLKDSSDVLSNDTEE